jgi:hypothetical protein
VLERPDGTATLSYGGLTAVDAAGRRLPSEMHVLDDGSVGLDVDDRAATYPLTIDPLLAVESKLTGSDSAALDEFGYAVAIDGDTAVVGAQNDETSPGVFAGSASVFVRAGDIWTEQAKLAANGAFSSASFGESVGVSGDTIVVGSRNSDTSSIPFGRA